MSTKKYLTVVIITLALVGSGSVAAFADGSHKIMLQDGLSLQGKPLAAGEYRISWVDHAQGTTVTVARNKNVVATVEARVQDAGRKFAQNVVIFEEKSDGTRPITEIRMGGTTQAIVFN